MAVKLEPVEFEEGGSASLLYPAGISQGIGDAGREIFRLIVAIVGDNVPKRR